jgi:carboxypeptidase Taq
LPPDAPRNLPEAYGRLELKFHDIGVLGDTIRLLHWDQATMMPPQGTGARSEQLARLEAMRHERLTAPDLAELLADAEAGASALDPWQAANLREMRRLASNAAAVPADLVAAHSRASSLCEMVWRDARRNSDFAAVRANLQEVLDLTRETGAARGAALACRPYDALLSEYEPGASTAAIDALFDDLAAFMPAFLDDVMAHQDRAGAPVRPDGPFDIDVQRALCRDMAATVGLDFDGARVDESAHPFSSGVPEDTRITVRYREEDFSDGLMSVLHETGHAMYERGRPADWRYQPVGRARGMVIHESQSLLVEMQACRSRAFYEWAGPRLRQAFAGNGPAWETENLHRLAIRVEPGHIRVDADEVTYPAHVILRYRLELALLAGDLSLADLPGAWNDGMRALLGIEAPDDRRGCLQDIHWYSGSWGYFPTYTLGAMAAAQIFEAAVQAEPSIPEALAQGDFAPLMDWLRRHVHGQGSRLPTDGLLAEATGRPLDAAAFKAHLHRRYLDG